MKKIILVLCAVSGLLVPNSLTHAATQYWTGSTGCSSSGGTGTWDTTTANWNSTAGTCSGSGLYVSGSDVDLRGAAGTVTIANGALTCNSITIGTDGYILVNSGATPQIIITTGQITVNAGTTTFKDNGANNLPIYAGTSAGLGTLTILGTGTLTSGGTALGLGGQVKAEKIYITGGGKYVISNSKGTPNGNNTLGDSYKLDNNSTLRFAIPYATTMTHSTKLGITIASGGGAIEVDSGKTVYFQAVNTITGTLTKTGAGALNFTGVNTGAGGFTLNGGSFQIGNNAAVGTGKLTLNAGTLSSDGTTARSLTVPVDVTGDVTLGATTTLTGGLTFGTGAWTLKNGDRQLTVASTVTINSAIGNDSARKLTKAGSGTLQLGGGNTYGGGTAVTAGTLEGMASGSIKGTVTVSGTGILKLSSASAMDSVATLNLPATPTAGTVNLNFSGQQTVNKLYLGAVQKASGIWNAARNDAFAGTGSLYVTAGPVSTTTVNTIAAVCAGQASALSATVTPASGQPAPTGTVTFTGSVDGSLGSVAVGGTLNKVLSATQTITASYPGDDNNNPSSDGAGKAATVNAMPSAPATTGGSVCGGGSVSLSAGGSGGTVKWYSDSGLSTQIATGGSYSPTVSSTTTYWVTETSAAGCFSPASTVVAVVNAIPSAPAASSPQSFCSDANKKVSDLLVTGQNIKWYDAATDGNLVAGTTLLANGVTYYASQTQNGCEGSARAGVAVVFTTPPAPGSMSASATTGKTEVFDAQKLLGRATGTGLGLTAVQSPTANGGTATLVGNPATGISYTAPGGQTADTLTYTLTDANGCSTPGTITVTISSGNGTSPSVVSAPTYANGKFSVTFAGVPDTDYTIEYAEDSAAPPWTKLRNVTAGSNGLFVVEDEQASSTPSRYYRTVWPSY
jgi:autotransporter-associated beta strand protein